MRQAHQIGLSNSVASPPTSTSMPGRRLVAIDPRYFC